MTLKDFDAFDADDLRRCAEYSAMAYRSDIPAGATGFWSDRTDTQGFVAVDGKTVYVAFRGTANLRDWVTDCRVRLITGCYSRDGKGRVHLGFDAALNSVLQHIAAAADRSGMTRIVFTGHSLGGALAMLCADRLPGSNLDTSVYTFGQPRIGDKAFADSYNERLGSRTFRMINRFDPVPWVPGVFLGYRHAGQELFIDADNRLIVNPSLWAKLGRVWHELTAQPALLMGPMSILQLINDADAAIGDHSADGYEALTRSIAKQLTSQSA